jgi:hypothetical protein
MSEGAMLPDPDRPRVVLTPEVAGGLWLDPACAAVFEAWGKERLRPVVNRDLLMRYCRLWQALGLSTLQVRRWSWWFTHPATACFMANDRSVSSSAIECCSRLALAGGARCVIHRAVTPIPTGPVPWLTAADLLALELAGNLGRD